MEYKNTDRSSRYTLKSMIRRANKIITTTTAPMPYNHPVGISRNLDWTWGVMVTSCAPLCGLSVRVGFLWVLVTIVTTEFVVVSEIAVLVEGLLSFSWVEVISLPG